MRVGGGGAECLIRIFFPGVTQGNEDNGVSRRSPLVVFDVNQKN